MSNSLLIFELMSLLVIFLEQAKWILLFVFILTSNIESNLFIYFFRRNSKFIAKHKIRCERDVTFGYDLIGSSKKSFINRQSTPGQINFSL